MLNKAHNLSLIRLKVFFVKQNCFYFKRYGTKASYNVLFFGSDAIGLNSLRRINYLRKHENIINNLHLVTANSSKNKSAIEKYALNEDIKILKWPNLNEANYDIGLIVAFGHLIKKDVLDRFPLGMVNVHPSLLPRWRGAAPIIHTLLHGDKIAGVSLMRIKPDKFDVGEIISQKTVPVPDDILLPDLTQQLSDIGGEMLVDCMKTLPASLDNAKPQSNEGVTYAKKINKSISEVRWSEMTASQVYNLYRAIYGIYPLTTTLGEKQIKLFNAFVKPNQSTDCVNESPGFLEYCAQTDAIRILCKDKKFVYFKSLRILGKREITAIDFYNGYIKNKSSSLDKRKCMVGC